MSSGLWIFDLEGDGLKPTKLHVLSVSSADESVKKSTPDYEDMRRFFKSAKVLVGHNIARFDIVVVERLLGVKVKAKIVDTLALSWILFPLRPKHGLASWGETLGVPKPEVDDWEGLTYEEYEHRCSEDVRINTLLWGRCWKYLLDLYGTEKKVWRYLDYISFKMHCARLQEESGWHVDRELASTSLREMEVQRDGKVAELAAAMPQVPVIRLREKPKRFFKADGSYSKLGEEWIRLLAERGLPSDHDKVIETIVNYDPPNPNSNVQIKDWLYSLGWIPQTLKVVKNKVTNEVRQIPQINLDQGKGVCPSIKRLFDKESRLEALDGLSILNARIPLIKGILKASEDTGKATARIQGLTNTLRFQHAELVNLPRADRPFSSGIRGSLVAAPGCVLCGADLASLEDRIKMHYVHKYDENYINLVSSEDYDPHLSLAVMAGMMTQAEKDFYIWHAKGH